MSRPDERMSAVSIARTDDGASLVRVEDVPGALPVFVAAAGDQVIVDEDLVAVVRGMRSAGVEPQVDPARVRAFVAAGEPGDGEQTLLRGVARVRPGRAVRVAGAAITAERDTTDRGAATDLRGALGAAVASVPSPVVLLGEDLASAALLNIVEAPSRAIRVRAASTRAAEASAADTGPSRAREAAAAAGVDLRTVHPATEQFKKDLSDLVATQDEPLASLEVYALHAALRDVASSAPGAAVVAADGLRGAGVTGSVEAGAGAEAPSGRRQHAVGGSADAVALRAMSVLRAASAAATRAAGAVRARVGVGGRRPLDADHLLRVSAGAAPLASARAVEEASADAARRAAPRFGIPRVLPFASDAVASALGTAGADSRAVADLAGLRAASVASDRPAIDQDEWNLRLKGTLHQVLRSESFGARPFIDQRAALEAFEAYVAGKLEPGAGLVLWRLVALELWLRAHVDARTTTASTTIRIRRSRSRPMRASSSTSRSRMRAAP